ncbi:MAG: 3'-5' exonuclease [Deltaproteobacteria bacterium]|nr:3'-5' exonuclease [Deltaproteobacteria bacterium]
MYIQRLARTMARLLHGDPEHPGLAANADYFDTFDQNIPLAECEFTVVDTELTGLNPHVDEIVSIGAVRIRGLRIEMGDCFYSLVHPRVMTKTSILIHHITPDEVLNSPRLFKVLPEFIDYAGRSLLVGHHIGLDVSFLGLACRKIYNAPLPNHCLDTMRLAQVYEADLWENYYDQYDLNVSYNLADLTHRYDLPVFDHHNALEDALQTAYLFLFLVKKLKKGGIVTLRDLFLAGRSWRWYF